MDISLDAKTEGTLIFSYIRRLGPSLRVQNFEFKYFGFFQKNEYVLGYEDYKIGLDLGVISMHFKVNVQNG